MKNSLLKRRTSKRYKFQYSEDKLYIFLRSNTLIRSMSCIAYSIVIYSKIVFTYAKILTSNAN